MSGWSDSLNFLRAGDFGRTRPLSVSAFPRVYCRDSSKAFQRRDDRADSVHDKVNRVGRRRWKRSSVALAAAARSTGTERMAWAFIDLRGISTTFVGWLLCDFNREMCRKDTNNGEWTIHRRRKEAQVEKNKRFPLTCCWVRQFRGRMSKPVNAVQEHVTEWRCLKTLASRPRQL